MLFSAVPFDLRCNYVALSVFQVVLDFQDR